MTGSAGALRAQRRAAEDVHDEYVDALTGFLDARAGELVIEYVDVPWGAFLGQGIQALVRSARFYDAKAVTDPVLGRWADRADTALEACRQVAGAWRAHPDFRERWLRP